MERKRQEKKGRGAARSTDASVFRNVLCVTRALFHAYPKTIWVTPLYVICRVLVPFLGTLIPAAAIAGIMEGEPKKFFLVMMGMLFLSMAAGICCDISRQYLQDCRTFTRFHVFLYNYIEKVLTKDYVNVEPAERQKEISLGGKAVIGGNWGAEKLMTESVEFIVQLLGLSAYAAAVLTLDYRILLVLLFTFLLDFVLRGHAVRYYDRHRIELSEVHRKQEYLQKVSLDLGAGKDIRVYHMDGWFHRIFEKLHANAVDFQRRAEFRFYIPAFGNQFCVAGQEILAYFVLVSLVLSEEITVAEFALQLGMVRGFTNWIFGVSVSCGALKKANGETNDYRYVMEMPGRGSLGTEPVPICSETGSMSACSEAKPTPVCTKAGSVPVCTEGPEIEFRDVSFRYPGAEEDTISHFSFKIKPKEKVALVGNNGAGKTTLVKLLCGLYQPTGGNILVNGEDISGWKTDEYQKLLSVVFQDAFLLAFTVEMNVSGTVPDEEEQKKVKEALQEVGLREKVGRLPEGTKTYVTQTLDDGGVDFSGGERQRLLLARAVYQNGPILILDEPTAALDPIAESSLYEEYNHMTRDKTALFISHRLASTKFCDRILLLENGTIAEEGTHEALMEKHGRYRELFDIQSHYYRKGGVRENEA
ncbi:MAG: ABC transporter ATP-binding protein/permease [Acetatifactor sp.]|nr:ABC transporter ATP-binding protein/permease [Acetatifactor sp.]